MKLTLLGTGTPIPDPKRRGPSQVLEVEGDLVLVDTGSGVLHRLLEAGYDQAPLKLICFTHLHSDHTTGLADLLWAGWIMRWWNQPPQIIGPPGTADMVKSMMATFKYDIGIRMKGERLHREWLEPRAQEMDEGWAMEGNGWRLSAFRVDHMPVDQAFGFRMDAGARSVVISGDTRPCENLIRHAEGVDLLVHEVNWRRGVLARRPSDSESELLARWENIAHYHTFADEVGQIATRAGAKHLVLSHILFRGGTPEDIRADIAPNYRGPITVGEDLQVFELNG